MAENLLEVKDLEVDFRVGDGKVVTAIKDVNFSLIKGHTLGIVGESGCGKSVTAQHYHETPSQRVRHHRRRTDPL